MLRPITLLIGLFAIPITVMMGLLLSISPALPSDDLLATASWRISMEGTENQFTITDVGRGLTITRSNGISSSGGLTFSPTGERIMIPHGDGVSVFDMQTNSLVRTPSTARPRLLNSAWSTDGGAFMLLTGDQTLNATSQVPDSTILVLNADTGETISIDADVLSASFSPSGRHVAILEDDAVRIFDLETDTRWQAAPIGEDERLIRFGWSPDGAHLAYFLDRDSHTDVYLLDTSTQATRNLTADIEEDITSLHWSPDGRRMAVIAGLQRQRVLYLIDHERDTVERIAADGRAGLPRLWGVQWAPDSERFSVQTGSIAWGDTAFENARLYTYNGDGHLQRVASYADGGQWSADSRYLLYRSANPTSRLGVFDSQTGSVIEREIGIGISLITPSWHSDSRHVLYSELGRLFRWDVRTDTIEELAPNEFGVIVYAVYE